MAGEWIPIDITLGSKPEVQELVDLTGQPVEVVVYRLLQLWGWASLNSADGTARATPARLARVCGGDEPFWLSVEAVGWISFDNESVTISKWGDRFSSAAKARAVDRKRKNTEKTDAFRELSEKIPSEGGRNSDYRRGEDRTEEKKNTNTVATSVLPKRQKRIAAPSRISWSVALGWEGIEAEDRSSWEVAFPGASIDVELAKATVWLAANPTKAGKRNWAAFLGRWLAKCQDGGGTRVCVPPRVSVCATNPLPQARRRYWRDQYARNMTDAEFHLAQQSPPEVKQLAQTLKVAK